MHTSPHGHAAVTDPHAHRAHQHAGQTGPRTLSARLKDDNWALHAVAERSPGARLLMGDEMTLEQYASMLMELLPVHAALDAALRAASHREPAIAAMVSDEQLVGPHLIHDLGTLRRAFGARLAGVIPDPLDRATPGAGTTRFIDAIHAHAGDPWHVLGLHYVRTGQTNGNAYLARSIRRRLGLGEQLDATDPRAATRYLDPFGARQREVWGAFKGNIDALVTARGISQDQQDRVFAGTRDAYLYTIGMTAERHRSAEELLAEHGAGLDRAAFEAAHRPG